LRELCSYALPSSPSPAAVAPTTIVTVHVIRAAIPHVQKKRPRVNRAPAARVGQEERVGGRDAEGGRARRARGQREALRGDEAAERDRVRAADARDDVRADTVVDVQDLVAIGPRRRRQVARDLDGRARRGAVALNGPL
jgi:hypothetical protein